MQIVSFLFKKFVKIEKPDIKYFFTNPKEEIIKYVNQDTGEVFEQTIRHEYTTIDSNAILVRKTFDQDDINFGILIPISGVCDDSFVDPNLLNLFMDVDFNFLDSSNINNFVLSLESLMLPYSDNSTNFNYLREYIKSYYKFYKSEICDEDLTENTFLKYIFEGYTRVLKDFDFVERKPLYLSLMNNVYKAFKDFHLTKLNDSLIPLQQNATDLKKVEDELSKLDDFNDLASIKDQLLNINELQIKRKIKEFELRTNSLKTEFEKAILENDYNKVKRLLNDCSSLNIEIQEINTEYSDLYSKLKKINNQVS
jgi:hypothetical protein